VPPSYFVASSSLVGAGVERGAPDPGSSWAAAGVAGLSLSARFQAGRFAPSALESSPVSCWVIAGGLVAPSVPGEGLRGTGAIVEPPGASATPAGLELEFRFCDVVSNFPIRFATEGRGRSSGSGLSREWEGDQRQASEHAEQCYNYMLSRWFPVEVVRSSLESSGMRLGVWLCFDVAPLTLARAAEVRPTA
jgi:hypothetical protein